MKNYLTELSNEKRTFIIGGGNYLDQKEETEADKQCESNMEEPIYNYMLSVDKDIFSNIPYDIKQDSIVALFLHEFRQCYYMRVKDEYEDITFPKLHAMRDTDGSIEIDWIFNYFRAYFSFDKYSSSYGLVEDNPDKHIFNTSSKRLSSDNFSDAIYDAITFILERV